MPCAGGSSKSGAKRDSKWCIGRGRGDRHRSAKPEAVPSTGEANVPHSAAAMLRGEGRGVEHRGRTRAGAVSPHDGYRQHRLFGVCSTLRGNFWTALLTAIPIHVYFGPPEEKGSLRKPPFSERTMSRTASLFLVPAVLLLALAASASAELPASPTEGDATVTTSTTTVAPASECVEPASAEAGETVPAGVVPGCSEAMLEIIRGMIDEQYGDEGGAAIAKCTDAGGDIHIMCGDVDVVRSGGSVN